MDQNPSEFTNRYYNYTVFSNPTSGKGVVK